MNLQDGAVYMTPDGRRFRAKLETRRYAPDDPAWTFIPARDDNGADGIDGLREMMSRMLFLEGGSIIRFDFERHGIVVATGWTVEDLRAAS
jgi:hypothetical protein